jgi:hypothetical protein
VDRQAREAQLERELEGMMAALGEVHVLLRQPSATGLRVFV